MKEKERGKKTFYGDGLTSKAFQYQFYIFFKQVQGHWGKRAHEIVLPLLPLPWECIYKLILKLKHTWFNTADNPVYTLNFFQQWKYQSGKNTASYYEPNCVLNEECVNHLHMQQR